MKIVKFALLILIGASFSSAVFAMKNDEGFTGKEVAFDIALARKHFEAINERDIQNKKALFEEVYTPDVHFSSPHGVVDGRTELEKLFDGIHQQSPKVIFQDIGEIEVQHDVARIHWAIIDGGVSNGLTGDDFVKFRGDKISEVYIIVNGWTKDGIPKIPGK